MQQREARAEESSKVSQMDSITRCQELVPMATTLNTGSDDVVEYRDRDRGRTRSGACRGVILPGANLGAD